MKNREKYLATAVLMSTIIGAGVFGLPYAAMLPGFLVSSLILILVLGLMLVLHLFYVDIVETTNKEYQLTGYISHYLGKRAKKFIGFFIILTFYGSLLVYGILGGDFLHIFLAQFINLPQIYCSLILFFIGAIALYFGLKIVSKWDLAINLILVGIIIILLFVSIDKIDSNNLIGGINLHKSVSFYGAIFYALLGIATIPEVRRILSKNNHKSYKKVVVIGTIIPAVIYLIFMFVVLGMAGQETTPDAIYVLEKYIGKDIIAWGSLFGFLMICSSFFSLGLALKQTYIYDFNVSKNRAWIYTCSVPLLLLLLGVSDFITVIEIMGVTIGAFEGTAIILMYNKIKTRKTSVRLLSYFMTGILLAGFGYALYVLL